MKFTPHEYQKKAIDFIKSNRKAALFLDMGLGKTVSTLTALQELPDRGKVLVIAPLRVAESTWPAEIEKWDHLDLTYSCILGSKAKRENALLKEADVYIINVDNIVWLIETLGRRNWRFNTVVIDELSTFKRSNTKRFKHLAKVIGKCDRVIGLTGTPMPKGYEDLFSQVFLLDGGERLGRYISHYRERYFYPDKVDYRTGMVYSRTLKPGAKESIDNKLKDLAITMKAEDYLTMPDKIVNNLTIKLPDKVMKDYRKFEREYIMELSEVDDAVVFASTAAVVSNKLSQLSNGAVYDEDKNVHVIHNAKLDVLQELLETSNGQSLLVFYTYQHDADRIIDRFGKKYKILTTKDADIVNRWNSGEPDILLCHPASAGHGLNLQAGGHIIVWFSLDWNYELYAQANARLYRQGQESSNVVINHIIAKDTLDEVKLETLQNRADNMKGFMDVFREKVNKYKKEVAK